MTEKLLTGTLSLNTNKQNFWFTETIHIALFYPEREHNKDAIILWLYKLTPIWFEVSFLEHIFDF